MIFSFDKILSGKNIQLSKLTPSHLPELSQALFDKNGFFVQQRGFDTVEKVQQYLLEYSKVPNRCMLVATLLSNPKEYVATSSYFDFSEPLFKLEIGFTWVATKWQRTFVNTELKLLMLSYAFEVLGVKRVQFSVQPINQNSLNAMKRLGITLEGTLRKWRYNSINDCGHRCIFSVTDDEWLDLKKKLLELQNKY